MKNSDKRPWTARIIELFGVKMVNLGDKDAVARDYLTIRLENIAPGELCTVWAGPETKER